jgi:quinol monooxygenase YgiN
VFGLYVRITVEPQKRHELLQLFDYITDDLDSGCLERCVYKDIHTPESIVLIEQWTDLGLINAYMKSDKYHAILGGVKVLGTLNQVSMLDFDELSVCDMNSQEL